MNFIGFHIVFCAIWRRTGIFRFPQMLASCIPSLVLYYCNLICLSNVETRGRFFNLGLCFCFALSGSQIASYLQFLCSVCFFKLWTLFSFLVSMLWLVFILFYLSFNVLWISFYFENLEVVWPAAYMLNQMMIMRIWDYGEHWRKWITNNKNGYCSWRKFAVTFRWLLLCTCLTFVI